MSVQLELCILGRTHLDRWERNAMFQAGEVPAVAASDARVTEKRSIIGKLDVGSSVPI